MENHDERPVDASSGRTATAARALNAHIWDREEHEHYVEPEWVSERLFAVERFDGAIVDPSCGFGRIVKSARRAGYSAFGHDIVERGYGNEETSNFLLSGDDVYPNVVCNPPFDLFANFAHHALAVTTGKVAMIWLVRRLNAARWLQGTPLARVYLLTPRPSMPPGHTITAGQKPGGGTQDFCWLVWDKAHVGAPNLLWLHRDAP